MSAMDDDAWCALFGEVRGVADEWAVFAPVETADGTLWRGINGQTGVSRAPKPKPMIMVVLSSSSSH